MNVLRGAKSRPAAVEGEPVKVNVRGVRYANHTTSRQAFPANLSKIPSARRLIDSAAKAAVCDRNGGVRFENAARDHHRWLRRNLSIGEQEVWLGVFTRIFLELDTICTEEAV